MNKSHSVTIEIPDVEQMSDEEIASLARENDGRWSSQTKALLEQFGVSKLDLNLPWLKPMPDGNAHVANETNLK